MVIPCVPVSRLLLKAIDKSKLTPIRKVYFRKNGTRVEQTFWVKKHSEKEKQVRIDQMARHYTEMSGGWDESGGFISSEGKMYFMGGVKTEVRWEPLDKYMLGAKYQVHTHISQGTFSIQDVLVAVKYKIPRISVISGKKTYKLTITNFPEVDIFTNQAWEIYRMTANIVMEMNISVKEKYALHGKMYMSEIANVLGGTYVES